MKKIFITLMVVSTCIFVAACGKTQPIVNNFNVDSTFYGILSDPTNAEADNSGGVERLVYTSPIQNDFLFIESRLVDYVGEDKFKEWTHAEAAKGTYKYTVNVLNFIHHFGLTKEQFAEACNIVPDMPLYTANQIDCLYDSDIEKVLKYIKTGGAVYSNGKLYSAEWMELSPVSDYISECINIDEIKTTFLDTKSAIETFSTNQANPALSYEDKVKEYEAS